MSKLKTASKLKEKMLNSNLLRRRLCKLQAKIYGHAVFYESFRQRSFGDHSRNRRRRRRLPGSRGGRPDWTDRQEAAAAVAVSLRDGVVAADRQRYNTPPKSGRDIPRHFAVGDVRPSSSGGGGGGGGSRTTPPTTRTLLKHRTPATSSPPSDNNGGNGEKEAPNNLKVLNVTFSSFYSTTSLPPSDS